MMWLTAIALGAEPVEGAYALEVELHTDARVPVVGWVRIVNRSHALLELRRHEGGWQATQRLCDVVVEGGRPARTIVPEAFVRAMPTQVFPVQVDLMDGGWAIQIDAGPTWVGQEPDGRLVDSDHDGHPGATVWVELPFVGRQEVYVTQHAHSRMAGIWGETGATGTVDVLTLEQTTLGASHRLLLQERPTRVVQDAGRFRILASPSATCSGVLGAIASGTL